MIFTHPDTMSAYQWRARKAGLLSNRAVGRTAADDPRVAECDDALAYLRLKSRLEQNISLVGPQLRDYILAHSIDRMREKCAAALLREAGGS